MQQRCEGMTLLDFMIYLLLLAMITTLSASWVARLWPSFMAQTRKRASLVTLYTAHDVLRRDLKKAPHSTDGWKKRDSSFIVWKNGEKDVGWKKENNTLVRITGRFDAKKEVWKKSTKSMIAKQIDTVSFAVKGSIDAVSFTLKEGNVVVTNEVRFETRKLPWKIKEQRKVHPSSP